MLQTPVSPEPTHSTPFAFELGLRFLDVRDADGEAADVRLELEPFALGLPERDRHLARPQLLGVVRVERQAEHLVVPGERPRRVARRDVDEVDPLDVHQGVVPSRYGA